MLDRVRLHRSLPQDFVATLELAEELIVQVVSIGQENQRRILHRRLFDDAAGVEEHRQALARTLRVPDDADAAIAFRAALHLARPIGSLCFPGPVFAGGANRFIDRGFDGVELMITRHQLMHRAGVGIVFEDDEVADEIEKAPLLENAPNERLQLQRRLRRIELALRSCARP